MQLDDPFAAPLEHALDQQRAFWRFVGIVSIVILAFYALAVVGAIGAGILISLGNAA
jgi:hypothetical protein